MFFSTAPPKAYYYLSCICHAPNLCSFFPYPLCHSIPLATVTSQGLYDGGNTSELVANLTWVATCMCAQLLGSIERRPRPLGGAGVLPSMNYGQTPYTQLHQQDVDLRGTKALQEMAFKLYIQGGATKTVTLGWEARKASLQGS
jgi:hypothetical protein